MTCLGTRMKVDAADVLAGDFTTATGYRRVSAVELVHVTSGRGSKRATVLTGVRFHRVDGTVDTSVFPDSVVTVYRQEVAP